MKKTISLAVFAAVASISLAESINVTASTEDVYYTDKEAKFSKQPVARIGTETSPQTAVYVMPFRLPAIPAGQNISAASLTVNVEGTAYSGGNPLYLKLSAARTASGPSIKVTDRDAETVLFTSSAALSSIPAGKYTISSNDERNEAFVKYLREIYKDSDAAGKYVFLTLAPNEACSVNSRYITVSSADSAKVENQPVLTIETSTGK